MAGRGSVRNAKPGNMRPGAMNTRQSQRMPAHTEVGNTSTMSGESNTSGSRYNCLSKTCIYCQRPCVTDKEGKMSSSIQCTVCKDYVHAECEQLEPQILDDLRVNGTYKCDGCKELNMQDREGSFSTAENGSIGSESMNSDEILQAQFDNVLGENKGGQGEGNEIDMDMQGFSIEPTNNNFSPRSSTPTSQAYLNDTKAEKVSHGADNQVVSKIDQMMSMMKEMSDVKQNFQRIDKMVKDLGDQQEGFFNGTTNKIKSWVQESVKGVFETVETTMKEKLDKEIDIKIAKGLAKKIENGTDKTVHDMIEKKVEETMGDYLQDTVDQMVENTIGTKVQDQLDRVVDGKIDSALDRFSDKLWRKKNVIVYNIPEGNQKSVQARKEHDFKTIHEIFIKFIPFEEYDIEGLPVRVGKIGNKPRLLRVTFKSEYQLRELVYGSRERQDLLNPVERDNKKKIYINRDFNEQEREARRAKQAEKRRLGAAAANTAELDEKVKRLENQKEMEQMQTGVSPQSVQHHNSNRNAQIMQKSSQRNAEKQKNISELGATYQSQVQSNAGMGNYLDNIQGLGDKMNQSDQGAIPKRLNLNNTSTTSGAYSSQRVTKADIYHQDSIGRAERERSGSRDRRQRYNDRQSRDIHRDNYQAPYPYERHTQYNRPRQSRQNQTLDVGHRGDYETGRSPFVRYREPTPERNHDKGFDREFELSDTRGRSRESWRNGFVRDTGRHSGRDRAGIRQDQDMPPPRHSN